MDGTRLTISFVVLLGMIGLVTLVPLPIGHIRATAVVQLADEAVDNVFVPVAGTLERLHVRDGQKVEKGELLAEFRSLELESAREEARSQHDIRLVHGRALRARADLSREPQEEAMIALALARTSHERDLFGSQVGIFDRALKRLEVRAPRAGVVLGAPRREALGRHWQQQEATPLCKIGAPQRQQALLPLSAEDYRLLKDMVRGDPDVAVSIRLPGRDLQTFRGRVQRLSAAGECRVRDPDRAGRTPPGSEPLTLHYLATIDFLDADSAVCPGTRAEIKVPCKWRTCCWWLWRALARTFDLGLI